MRYIIFNCAAVDQAGIVIFFRIIAAVFVTTLFKSQKSRETIVAFINITDLGGAGAAVSDNIIIDNIAEIVTEANKSRKIEADL